MKISLNLVGQLSVYKTYLGAAMVCHRSIRVYFEHPEAESAKVGQYEYRYVQLRDLNCFADISHRNGSVYKIPA